MWKATLLESRTLTNDNRRFQWQIQNKLLHCCRATMVGVTDNNARVERKSFFFVRTTSPRTQTMTTAVVGFIFTCFYLTSLDMR